MVPLSVQSMDAAQIAKVTFTSADWAREVINNFNEDGFDSLVSQVRGNAGRGRSRCPSARRTKKIDLPRPRDHGLPFSTWTLIKFAEFLVAEAAGDDISHEGLRILLRSEGVSFQVIKTFKASRSQP